MGNSVYDVLYKNNGKFITLGRVRHTLTHYAEECFGVDYRYHKIFKGKAINEMKSLQDAKISYYVRRLDKDSTPNLKNIINIVNKSKNHKKINLEEKILAFIMSKNM